MLLLTCPSSVWDGLFLCPCSTHFCSSVTGTSWFSIDPNAHTHNPSNITHHISSGTPLPFQIFFKTACLMSVSSPLILWLPSHLTLLWLFTPVWYDTAMEMQFFLYGVNITIKIIHKIQFQAADAAHLIPFILVMSLALEVLILNCLRQKVSSQFRM